MRLSRYFMPTLREAPSDAQIVSHQLMLRAGMIRQEAAGIYAWLPLGLTVLKKIEQVVREEMNRAGAIEILMPTLQLADLWRERGPSDEYRQERVARQGTRCRPRSSPSCGGRAAATMTTARRCCASGTATTATCYTVPQRRRSSPTYSAA